MERCVNKYRLPIKKEDIVKRHEGKSSSHRGKLQNSVDFMCPEDTLIYASAGGRVVWLKNDSKVGGPNKKFWDKGNRIVIEHKNKEYSAYEHLRYKGSRVKVEQKVRKGKLIGYSGNTGYSFGPHLHFEIFNNPDKEKSEGTTLKVVFEK